MRVSVVVCTYNRADALAVTLDALRYQRYGDFEVVVVNGPSTDHTPAVLDAWRGRVKVVENPLANLSVSRNLGIRAAAGELVAFIDDDAIPEFDWLGDVVAEFRRDEAGEVAGVGGLVFDHTGTAFQYRFSAASRLGEPILSDTHPFDEMCLPGAFRFPYLQGTNATFRRAVLDEVGGFDETFDYYLDETDVCARIVDAGFLLRQLDDAHVHHKFLPSALRNTERVYTRWYPVLKNLTYFGYRHALDDAGEAAILAKAWAEADHRVAEAAEHERVGRLPAGSTERIRAECLDAIGEGIRLGRAAGSERLPPMGLGDPEFLPFPVRERRDDRVVVLVAAAYGDSVNGGISRFITDVAPHLRDAGYEVRVVTRSPDVSRVDFEDGVWVHRVDLAFCGALPGTSLDIDAFASVATTEVQRIAGWRGGVTVYGPAWDMEVLPVIRTTGLPVVAFLATPVAVTNNLDESPDYRPDPYARLLLDLEQEIFDTADLLHADSFAVMFEIGRRYRRPLDPDRVGIAYLGSEHRAVVHTGPRAEGDGGGDRSLRVLYVGRLEPRKGTDTLLAAAEMLAPDRPWLRFTLAGAENLGEGAIREPWLARHRGASWLSQIEFLGRTPAEQLDALYETSDIAVVPSRFESFGLTVVEAMRHEIPVVASDAGALPELAQDGHEALLVPPGDPAALAKALERLIDDPALRSRLGREGRRRYEDEFTIDAAACRLDDLLRRVHLLPLDVTRLDEGESIELRRPPLGSTRVAVRTASAARLALGNAVVDVDATRVHRLALPPGSETVPLEVIDGEVDVLSLVHVAAPWES